MNCSRWIALGGLLLFSSGALAMRRKLRLALILAAAFVPCHAHASFVTFSDQATFVAATGATSATGALPNLGSVGGLAASAVVGTVTFTIAAPSSELIIGNGTNPQWTTRIAGNDIAMSGTENLNATFAAPVFSAGFQFVEPQFDPQVNGPFVDSTFTVTLKSGAAIVGSFTFNAPNDAASFVGAWSDTAFNRLEIRETVGGVGNEFFGQFYSGTLAIPEPESYALILAGLGLLGIAAWRRRR
jgi:PEP-CTERM motif-containing protein